jgi:D-sedoheptulose 7-phosphate isomerase
VYTRITPLKQENLFMVRQSLESVNQAIEAVRSLSSQASLTFIESAAEAIGECFERGGKLLIAGNGGSLCDAAHFAEELTGFFRAPRKALPALCLSDPGHMSCVGNDLGFDFVFSRGVEAFGAPQDIFIGLTTSGNSPNIVNAFAVAKKKGLKTIAFLGKGGGKLKGVADIELVIEGFKTSDRIQEAHMAAIHILIELVEERLFSSRECLVN